VGLRIATILTTTVLNALHNRDRQHRPGCGGAQKAQPHPQQGGCILNRLGQRVCLGPVLDVSWV